MILLHTHHTDTHTHTEAERESRAQVQVSSSSERRLTELLAALLPQDAALLSTSAPELPAGEACFDHNTVFDKNVFFAQLAAQPPRELGHMLLHLYEGMYINTYIYICYYIDLLICLRSRTVACTIPTFHARLALC